jgi:hypothetical protein
MAGSRWDVGTQGHACLLAASRPLLWGQSSLVLGIYWNPAGERTTLVEFMQVVSAK